MSENEKISFICNKISFICNVAQLSAENQNLFFERIKGIVTEEERTALQIAVSYFGMLLDPAKGEAMKKTMTEELYKEFNGAA